MCFINPGGTAGEIAVHEIVTIYRRRTANFDLYSAFIAIDQRGFFGVPTMTRGIRL